MVIFVLKSGIFWINLHKKNKRFIKNVEGRGIHNKFAQKLLSIGVSTSLMRAMVPSNDAFADEPGFFL